MTASKLCAGLKLRVESSIQKIYLTELERGSPSSGWRSPGRRQPSPGSRSAPPLGGWINSTLESNLGITIAGGSNDVRRNIIAFQGLGLPRDY